MQGGPIAPPQITQPYQPPNVCTDDGVGGAAHVMFSALAIIILPLLACFF